MSSEARKEQFRRANEKQKLKKAEAGIVRKTITLKAGETIKIVKESDPNEVDLDQKTKEIREKMQRITLDEIRKVIDELREKNKGTVALARQKDLAAAIQQIEEILKCGVN